MSYIWTSLHQHHQPAKLSDIKQEPQRGSNRRTIRFFADDTTRSSEGNDRSYATLDQARTCVFDEKELFGHQTWSSKQKKTNTGSQPVDVIFVVIKTFSLFNRNVKATRSPYLMIFFAAKPLSLYLWDIFYWNRTHVVLLMRFICHLFEILPRKLLPRWK